MRKYDSYLVTRRPALDMHEACVKPFLCIALSAFVKLRCTTPDSLAWSFVAWFNVRGSNPHSYECALIGWDLSEPPYGSIILLPLRLVVRYSLRYSSSVFLLPPNGDTLLT